MQNFFIQDLVGSTLALALFPLVMVFPGYVVGWLLDVLAFRTRGRLARLLIALILSNGFVPVTAYLAIRYVGAAPVLVAILVCAVGFLMIEVYTILNVGSTRWRQRLFSWSLQNRVACFIGIAWVLFSLLLLLDLQFGSKLYFATTSYDYATRIAIINAITRTGIPPVNPGYFPGQTQPLTYLYYYWYIPASIVDRLGADLVNSRHAMLAGEIGTGLCLMAAIALYLRTRNGGRSQPAWFYSLIGIQLLTVSGMDVIPVATIAIRARQAIGQMLFNGQIEGWNMPIMSWLNAITWVPNHVAAAAQCITALLLVIAASDGSFKRRLSSALLAGAAFASAFGSSVWVMVVFSVVWSVWGIVLLFFREGRGRLWPIICAGAVGLTLSLPFILDLLGSPGMSGASASIPLALYIRPFTLVSRLLPVQLQPIGNFLLLPLNYAMELGLFFFMGLLWLQFRRRLFNAGSPFLLPECIVLGTALVVLSFVYSNIITINDLGIRGWLLGQFVLLVWATDLIGLRLGQRPPWPGQVFQAFGGLPRIGAALQLLLVLGLLTTALEAFATRMWPMLVDWDIAGFPNDLSPDTNLGSRTFDARLAYAFIDRLPSNAVAQINPQVVLDRPSGLYGTIQMAVSDRTAYGVPEADYSRIKDGVAPIFKGNLEWAAIDLTCRSYSINVLIFNDVDPIWAHLPALETERRPIYQNPRYAVFTCGEGLQLPSG